MGRSTVSDNWVDFILGHGLFLEAMLVKVSCYYDLSIFIFIKNLKDDPLKVSEHLVSLLFDMGGEVGAYNMNKGTFEGCSRPY